ncbi:hypothetical protein DPMN_039545 [Dreissena polymorpha]|uniref:Uncharacterized protein n=1 Tax=Dreissena polymorpha TaxID=45954 RepID=A0A9D4CW34_DREPO|nr:hypothetical protein DPMN_039539 [Dreissena polymorpha]KAH3733120.1 hypothetical protein DPMN_039545 [Dreissena polymorpha]
MARGDRAGRSVRGPGNRNLQSARACAGARLSGCSLSRLQLHNAARIHAERGGRIT